VSCCSRCTSNIDAVFWAASSWRDADSGFLTSSAQKVCGMKGRVVSIVFGNERTEEQLVELFRLGGDESVILPLLKVHESADDVEVTVVLPHGERRTLYASFWFCAPLRVNGGVGAYQYSDCLWEEVADAIGTCDLASNCALRRARVVNACQFSLL
jgi:hypothetical protein